MAPRSRPQELGPPLLGDPPSAALLPKKLRSPILPGCYPALASEALRVLAQHPSQPFKTKRSKSMFLNRITLIGFTGQEPKTFATQAGKEITRVSVATTKRYQQDSRMKREDAMARLCALRRRCPLRSQSSQRCTRPCRRRTDVPRIQSDHGVGHRTCQCPMANYRNHCRVDQSSRP